MVKRVFAPLVASLVVCAFALVYVSCASLGPKEKAFKGYQAVHAAIAAVQDSERLLCVPSATDATKCSSALAPKVGLTDAKHVQINFALAKATKLGEQAGIALQTWRAGDPVPQTVTELSAVSNEVIALAQSLLPADSDVQRILAGAKRLIDAVTTMLGALKGGN